MQDALEIVEVGPRDGLQNEKIPVPTELKVQFIRQLLEAGLKEIEATSFVSPKWVPQMGDAAELWPLLPSGGIYSALVPNVKGLERATALGVDRIAVFTAASEAFTLKNINMTIDQSIEAFGDVVRAFREQEGSFIRGYVSTIFECPYAGRTDPNAVVEVMNRLSALGVDEISLGDTIGVATPKEVKQLIQAIREGCPPGKIAWHFHDTFGTAVANVAAALDAGYRRFDSSAAGLGGCPYAPGAAGNLATEDLVYFAERQGLATGVDIDLLTTSATEVTSFLSREPSSKAALATASRLSSLR